MDKDGGLLARACEGIRALDLPACIKDGELRYVAVNAAYARFFGLSINEFKGFGTYDLSGDAEDIDREDKERRALVFSTEEVAACRGRPPFARHSIRCERFTGDDGRLFLFGVFETMPSFELENQPGNEADILLGSGVLDLIDAGISIFDRDNRLLYNNSRVAGFYRSLDVDWRPGLRLEDIVGALYDDACAQRTDGFVADVAIRREWIKQRLAKYNLPYFEEVEQLSDGRWLRMVNKRLETGILVGLKIDVTEFKSHEVLLSKHIRETWLYREALEELPVPVFVRDGERRLAFVNAAYERMLGGNREKYIGMTEAEMFPSVSQRFLSENLQVLETGKPLQKEETVAFGDGGSVPVITRLGCIVTPDDERYIVGSITDVSVLKERENQLIAAQNHAQSLHGELERILHSLPVGVLILDKDLTIEYANAGFYELWEVDAKIDLIGKSFKQCMEISYVSGAYDYSGMTFEAAYQQRVGVLQSLDDLGAAEIRSQSGKVTVISSTRIADDKILISYADITAVRKRDLEISKARAELERAGEYMQDATRAMAQGLLLIEDNLILVCNDALSQMMEVPAECLAIGQSWIGCFEYCAARGDFGDSQAAAVTLSVWKNNVAQRQSFSWSFLASGKRWLTLEARISERGYWLVVVTDVTETKLREAELTGLLSRAEAADRAKSEFLANMSHEIRTPMNGVLGMAELLTKSNLDTRQKTFTDIIVKSGNALLTIINDILDFSKIDAGQMKLRKAPFDPVEAIEDVASLLSSAAAEKNIELVVRSDASVRLMVAGDAGRFRQIVTNLVSNAVKFTEMGHVLIDVSMQQNAGEETMLMLRVEDTGIGIPADKLHSIFDKFSQVDTSSTRRHEGTGLGLAITVGLVDLFGGAIDVDSKVGAGSLFTVNLPFEITQQRSEKPVMPPSAKSARVLVIDDNDVNRRTLTEQLRMWDIDGYAAENGITGLAILHEAAHIGLAIDAVILDYHMPGMNGVDVAGKIRSDHRFDDTAIIFLTSMDMVGGDNLFAGLNVQGHLMKPARAGLLRSTLSDVIRAGRQKIVRYAAATAGEAYAQRPLPQPSQPVDAPISSLDVLVAEDNDVNQIVFTQILQATGLRFAIVGNGKKALEAWETHRPAIILMDVSMPVMNGHQATQAIREREEQIGDGQRVPIIGVTAHALESDRSLCLAAGMDDYLAKPISPELLEAKVEQWLGREIPRRDTSSGSY